MHIRIKQKKKGKKKENKSSFTKEILLPRNMLNRSDKISKAETKIS